MARTTRVLVIDDLPTKKELVDAALATLGDRDASVQADLADGRIVVDQLTSAKRLVDLVAAEGRAGLERYDVVLVDFGLHTRRYGADGPLVTVDVPAADPEDTGNRRIEVEITTGVGVLLHLEQVLGAGEGARPAVYTFVDLVEETSRLFAPAAWAWFGVPVFPVRDPLSMARQLRARDHAPQQQARVQAAADALEELTEYFARTPSTQRWKWVTPGVGRDAYEWLVGLHAAEVSPDPDAYLSRGLIRRSTLFDRVTVDDTKQLHNMLIARLYSRLRDLEGCFGRAWVEDWPAPDGGTDLPQKEAKQHNADVRRTLRNELARSGEFWTADDIRVALGRHRVARARGGK